VVYNDPMFEKKEKTSKKGKRKSTGIGFAIWLLAALALLVAFIINQNRIVSNLKETGFFDRVFGKTPTFVENAQIEEKTETDKNDVPPIGTVEIDLTGNTEKQTASSKSDSQIESASGKGQQQESNNSATASKSNGTNTNSAVAKKEEVKQESKQQSSETTKSKDQKASETKKDSSSTKSSSEQKQTEVKTTPTMNIKLCFMTISSDGSVSTKEVTRAFKKSDSPLVDSINALITGPNKDEQNNGCKSLISTGTRLLSASVKNGVATLNFSSEFEFNQYGIEGSRGQLQQIVYTATAFPTVDSVQFLIDGEKKEYLGLEGVWIGSPLTRNSF